VLAATREGRRCKRKGKCHNCGKPGHWARECRSQKKDDQQSSQSSSTLNMSTSQTQAKQQPQQGSQPPLYTSATAKPANKPVGSANAVANPNDEPDGCWVADFMSEEDSKHVSSWSGSDVKVWEATHDTSLSPGEWEDLKLQYPKLDVEPPSPVKSAGGAQATITAVEEAKSAQVELYDYSATRHLSPYRNNFITYWDLEPPLYLNAANKQQFPAMGMVSWTQSTTSSFQSSKSKVPQVNPMIRPARDPEKQGAHAQVSGDMTPWDQIRNRSPNTPHDLSHVLTRDKSCDPIRFGRARSPLINRWQTMGMVNDQRKHVIPVLG
jgi:hypothetical protein